MYTLNYVIVHDEMSGSGVVLEGERLDTREVTVEVLIGAGGPVIGRERISRSSRVLTQDECMRLIGIVNPPKYALECQEIGDSGFYSMPKLHTWFVQTFGIGCREYTTDDTISYA